MNRFLNVAILFSALLLVLNVAKAQDGKISIELDRDEEIAGGLLVKNKGFWLLTNTSSMSQGMITTNRLTKFNADLSKQEYVVDDLKNLDYSPMYDPKYPDYLYLRHIPLKGGIAFNGKAKYYQINKEGKLRTYEEEKERDKEVDECTGVFTSMGFFGEIWTKKKSDNDLVLVLHDHETFKKTKKIINFSERKDKKKFRNWLYAGSSDNFLVLTRHEKNVKSYLIQTLVIDMKLGKIINNFDFEPKFKSEKYVIPATIGNSDKKGLVYYGNENFIHNGNVNTREDFRENGHGAINISKDGKFLYYYTLIADEKVEKNDALAQLSFHGTAKGFALIKMGLDGKEIYSQETPFKYKELGADLKNGLKGLTFYEQNNGEIRLEMFVESSSGLTKRNFQRYSMMFDNTTGKQVNHCLKGVKTKMRVAQKAKTSVESVEDLIPCNIKNEEKITKYIATKQIEGLYNVYEDGESQVLGIFVRKEQTLGLMYFKE